MSYSYSEPDGARLAISKVQHNGTVHVFMRDETFEGVAVILGRQERENVMDALAGDDYRVVPRHGYDRLKRENAKIEDQPIDADDMQEDLRSILAALGLGDHSRPYSPHECVTRDVLPAIERLKTTASMPEWERELLAGQAAQREIDTLKRERDDLRKQLHKAESQAAQPDRRPVQGRCPHCGGDSLMLAQGHVICTRLDCDALMLAQGHVICTRLDCDAPEVVDMLLHGEQPDRRQPEPDAAAVEALAPIVQKVCAVEPHHAKQFARDLVRHGVQVEVSE